MPQILGADMPQIFTKIKDSITFHINWVLILAIILIFVSIGVGIYIFYQKKLFNRKIIVFENLSGQGFQPNYKDTAKIVKIGDGGEEILFLRKKKVYRTAYGRKMGANTYWFAIGQDGYWYNVVLGDLDAKMGMLDIEPIDRDMRYMHVAVRKNIQERYRKVKFMEKYGTILLSGLFMLIMIVGILVLLKKMGEIASTINEGIKQSNEVLKVAVQVITHLENLQGGQVIQPL